MRCAQAGRWRAAPAKLAKCPLRHRSMTTETYSLSVLRRLEAESIHILREVAAEFERPVLMYSIGKDSSVLLRLAQKAFHPGRIPFPLLHIDTTYKFPEMYAFRDRAARRAGVELRVLRNEAALAADANPWDLGTVKCCGLLKTQGAARRAEGGQLRRGDRRRAARRGAFARQGAHLLVPRPPRPVGSEAPAARSCGTSTTDACSRARASGSFRCRTGPNSTSGATSRTRTSRSCRSTSPPSARSCGVPASCSRWERRPDCCRASSRSACCPLSVARLLPCTGADRIVGAHTCTDIIAELEETRFSERVTRVIDHDQDGSMEQKKREGYF